jgi:ribosomal protein L11 methyltransferase
MFELAMLVPQGWVEPGSDALIDQLGALSVSVQDADADSSDEQALFGEPGLPAAPASWSRSALTALFPSEARALDAATWLLAQGWGVQLQSIGEVAERDWVRLTQSQFTPSEVAPGFWIVPSWHEPPAGATHLIRLDPGQAFGTGSHATTRMCLRWIARDAHADRPWSRVLDYGCGSGILAIAACLFGAAEVDAVDIDPQAVETTRANALANGVRLRAATPEAVHGAYSVVLANILARPITLLAPLLSSHVAQGGALVLAGMLERQAAELQAAYSTWLALEVSDAEDGWILMTARRPIDARVA